ncbi:MAG: hypothetical protein C4293_16740, partial [Nitrospiraceae bacterium]
AQALANPLRIDVPAGMQPERELQAILPRRHTQRRNDRPLLMAARSLGEDRALAAGRPTATQQRGPSQP